MEEISTHALAGTIDFGIVTIREDEFEAALRFFVPKKITRDGRRTYNIAEFSTRNGTVYRAAVLADIPYQNSGMLLEAHF